MKEIRSVTLKGSELSHESIARALSFPAWYGNNLDALYDCLTDLSHTVLFIKDPHAKPENDALLRVIFDAAEKNRRLWVFIL